MECHTIFQHGKNQTFLSTFFYFSELTSLMRSGFVHVCWGELPISSLNHSIQKINLQLPSKRSNVEMSRIRLRQYRKYSNKHLFYLIFIYKRRSRINFPVSYKRPTEWLFKYKIRSKGGANLNI